MNKKKGFKASLDAFERATVNVELPKATGLERDLNVKSETEGKKKSYKKGYKDMDKLLDLFSVTFCKQFTFVMGYGRKTDKSGDTVKKYTDGWNDRLDKETE